MKRKKIVRNIFISSLICIFFSCSSKETHRVTIAFDSACTLAQQTLTYDVINKRASIWGIKEKTDLIDGKFDLIFYTYDKQDDTISDTLLTQILTQRGEIYITEIYQKNEIQAPLSKVYDRLVQLTENTNRETRWKMSSSAIEPSLISVHLEQISYFDSVFNSFKRQFPPGIAFAWTAKPDEDGFVHLLPLRTLHRFLLNPMNVKKSYLKHYEDYQELFVEFKEEYIKEWASITRNNISGNLAIVMDGKVLMYPRVSSEIDNGKLTINHNLDSDELPLIKSCILTGILDCKTKVVAN